MLFGSYCLKMLNGFVVLNRPRGNNMLHFNKHCSFYDNAFKELLKASKAPTHLLLIWYAATIWGMIVQNEKLPSIEAQRLRALMEEIVEAREKELGTETKFFYRREE